MAGGIDYIRQSAQMQEARDRYIKGSLTPPGPPTQHGIYASPEWTGQPYPSLGWQNIRQDQEPPEGWPRPPKFNEPGDVPGPPVQYGDPITPQTVKAGYGFIDNGIIEKNLYFYHPDHLGSSSYITDREGRITQHTEYIAFGEVLFEEHSVSPSMPYLFNGKELDTETNLTYFGARYLDMKTSLWLNTDPLSGYNPIQEIEHYIDGQHNGGIYNPMNMATYSYTYQNPIKYIDPNGKQVEWKKAWESVKQGVKDFVSNPLVLDALTDGGYSRGLREIEYAKTNPSTMEWAAFQAGENAREIKSEFMGGYGVGGIMKNNNVERVKLYRGVNNTSPAYTAAKKGNVSPRGGNASALEHNLGNTESIFTSWTTDIKVATNFALRPSGKRVILTADILKSKLVKSPNQKTINLIQSLGKVISEAEILVKGNITNANVKEIKTDK